MQQPDYHSGRQNRTSIQVSQVRGLSLANEVDQGPAHLQLERGLTIVARPRLNREVWVAPSAGWRSKMLLFCCGPLIPLQRRPVGLPGCLTVPKALVVA
jgi:hypothetical protein